MTDKIINKIDKSGLISLELRDYSTIGDRTEIDIKPWLFNGIILKEKKFREHLKNQDWSIYFNKLVALNCSIDTIIPVWAFMLVSTYLKPFAKHISLGTIKDLENELFQKNIDQIDLNKFIDKKVLVKGCSDIYIPDTAYVMISNKLIPVVKSLMFGEACSNVPIFKRKP